MEQLNEKKDERSLQEKAKNIRLILFDVDGVLTDGSLILGDDLEIKAFDVKDGMGITTARRCGMMAGILTGRKSECVARRGRELGMDIVIQGAGISKIRPLEEAMRRHRLNYDQIAYMGDDIQDLPVLIRVGFSAAPADGRPEVRENVDLITNASGGRGAAREMIEFILKAKGFWDEIVSDFLS